MPEVSFNASRENIPSALEFVRQYLGCAYNSIGSYVELALEEILVNIISYAYGDSNKGTFLLGCRWVSMDDVDQFCLWVKDWGKPFNPFQSVEKPDTTLSVDERDVGGLGVYLVKRVSSHYIYCESDGSNTVELYFRVPKN